ncbi:MAG: hypothetical protein ACLQF1_13215 [Methyloceanibacter sp.]
MSGYNPDFDWQGAEDQGLIVQQDVERVAVYTNPHDDLVIRQLARWDEEEDIFIVIARGNVEAVIARMRTCVGLLEEAELESDSQPKDRTAAERQRRHRANKAGRDRDSVTDGVTERDAPLLELVG